MKKNNKIVLRILSDFTLLVIVFYLPWWIFIPFTLLAAFVFDAYYELVLAGYMFDSLYGLPTRSFFSLGMFYTLYSALLLVLSTYLKQIFSFDSRR